MLAFDLLRLEGRDLRSLPLIERKRLLATIMPRVESHMQFVDAIDRRGQDFFRVVCEHDLEGIVAKPKYGPYYVDGLRTNSLKIKNPTYSQLAAREDLFETNGAMPRSRRRAPQLMLPVVV
jgi:ATP-dependent DNA ligase